MGLAIELFACSGGLALGFQRAGITFDFAFDRDPHAVASYAANLGQAPVLIDVADLPRMLTGGFALGEVDLIVADPPCSPWSVAGKRGGLDDPRDCLLMTCALIALLRPKAFLIANIPGLDTEPNWPIVQRHIGALSLLGYCIDYASLNAADFGVPQLRRRPFWFAAKTERRIQWPSPTHHDPARGPHMFGGRPWVTTREALQHLSPSELGRPIRVAKKPRKHRLPGRPSDPARTITGNAYADGALLYKAMREHPASQSEQPALVLRANGGRSSGGGGVVEWATERSEESGSAVVLSERAGKIIQGFPEFWQFLAPTKAARWSMLAQALPPPLAEAVARSIRNVIGPEAC